MIKEYLKNGIASFDSDPADSDYQRGYLAALVETLTFLEDPRCATLKLVK